MATLTIRNLSTVLVQRIKKSAKRRGVSMEQEVRDMLEARYASRDEALAKIRQRWAALPETTAKEIDQWRREDRR